MATRRAQIAGRAAAERRQGRDDQAATPLRILTITITYAGATEARALDELARLWSGRSSSHSVHKRPPAADRVEWFLLTTCEITTTQQTQECLRWYWLRWRIEDGHRVLKSGCRIEALQHKTAERLKRAIAINLVIARPTQKNESTSRLGWAMPYAS